MTGLCDELFRMKLIPEKSCKSSSRQETYGDYVRQMNDAQLASLLDMVQTDGFSFASRFCEQHEAESVSAFGCYSAGDWYQLMVTERPPENEPPKYGIM